MDDIRQTAIDQFRLYLERRQFSAHTIVSYTLDLRLFFTEVAVPLAQVSFREVDQFVEHQHRHSRSWATINRRLNALKHFFDFCLDQQWVVGNPVKPRCPFRKSCASMFWARQRVKSWPCSLHVMLSLLHDKDIAHARAYCAPGISAL
jgi:site-specific recombinase XerC